MRRHSAWQVHVIAGAALPPNSGIHTSLRRAQILVAMCGLCVAPRAFAQATGPIMPMTIEQAVREAVDHSLSLDAERYSISVAEARIVTAGLRPNPVLTVSGMLPDAVIFDNSVNPKDAIMRGDVLIERGGKRQQRLDVAREARAIADLQLQNTLRTLALDVQSAFIDVQLAKSSVDLARESLG